MDKDLLKKLTSEQALTAEETLRLDRTLDLGEASETARMVSLLPEDAPSMAWRSGLNERLATVSRKRRSALYWRFGTATAAVAACSFLVFSLVRPADHARPIQGGAVVENTKRASLEDAIIGEHETAANEASLGVQISFENPRH